MGKRSFKEKVCDFAINRRRLVFVIAVLLCIFCAFSSKWVSISGQLTDFLADTTDTRKGLTLMENEFVTYGIAEVMIENISYEHAEQIRSEIESIDGVKSVEFDDSDRHYKSACALFLVTFDGDDNSDVAINALKEIETRYAAFDMHINTTVGNPLQAIIDTEMLIVDAIAVIVIISVLLLTSKSYAEIIVILIVFGIAAVLNVGTNFIFSRISFVTDSVCVVLQLALAIDYAVMMCHRFTEERERGLEPKEAAAAAMDHAIPEILASSITTVSGLIALMFMEYKLALDVAQVMIKAIIFSMLTVFFVMPGLFVEFSDWMDRTKHKSFIPDVSFLGRYAYKSRKVVPIVFVVVIIAACICSNKADYVYIQYSIDSIRHNDTQLSQRRIDEVFGKKNKMAIIVPAGDFESESAIAREIEQLPKTVSVDAMADVEVDEGFTLKDKLNARQFAELVDIDIEIAQLLYTAYANENNDLGLILTDMDGYTIPLLDLADYILENRDNVSIELDDEMNEKLDDLEKDLADGRLQLSADNWSRIAVKLDLSDEEPLAHEYLSIIKGICARYYDEFYIVSETTSAEDLMASFSHDSLMVSVLSIAFIFVVLLLTFKSFGLPVLLIVVIQGSIWINFSRSLVFGEPLFFLIYLLISAIQMGSNIDYAIVISSRYLEARQTLEPKEAIIDSINKAFPTIITSGLMLALAGIAIGLVASNESISSIGVYLGQGTIISVLLVTLALPQIILAGDAIIQKTRINLSGLAPSSVNTGKLVKIDGRVMGNLNGYLIGEVHGYFRGDISASVKLGDSMEEDESSSVAPVQSANGNDKAGTFSTETRSCADNAEGGEND